MLRRRCLAHRRAALHHHGRERRLQRQVRSQRGHIVTGTQQLRRATEEAAVAAARSVEAEVKLQRAEGLLAKLEDRKWVHRGHRLPFCFASSYSCIRATSSVGGARRRAWWPVA